MTDVCSLDGVIYLLPKDHWRIGGEDTEHKHVYFMNACYYEVLCIGLIIVFLLHNDVFELSSNTTDSLEWSPFEMTLHL